MAQALLLALRDEGFTLRTKGLCAVIYGKATTSPQGINRIEPSPKNFTELRVISFPLHGDIPLADEATHPQRRRLRPHPRSK